MNGVMRNESQRVALDVVDILDTYHRHGESDALLLLPWFLCASTSTVEIENLVWFEVAKNAERLRVPVWCEVIRRLKGDPRANEVRAHYFNDLGMFFLSAGDPRCKECFLSALRLTKDVGRRIRTLARLGIAHSLLFRDWTRAEKFYLAALALGNAAAPDSVHLPQLRERLDELDHDRRGVGNGFEARRREARAMAQDYADLLLATSVPSL